MEWGTIGSVLGGMTGLLSLLFVWMNGKFTQIHEDNVAAHSRIDAANARIDSTQAIIMRMLEKQGR